MSQECKHERAVISIGVPTWQVPDVAERLRACDKVRGTSIGLASDTPLPPRARKRGLVQLEC